MSEVSTISEIILSKKAAPNPPLSVRTFGLTHQGHVRPSNEDQFLIAELTKSMKVLGTSLPQPKTQYSDEQGYLFIVADGMGGHQAGEQASAMAVESIEAFALNTLSWFFLLQGTDEHDVLKEFQAALKQADAKVCREAAHHRELAGMGTTVTIAYSVGSRLFVIHVGDSRCYLLHGSELQCLTHDHTLVAEMVSKGTLQPGEAARHRLRHVITNVVGGHELGVKVECHRVELEANDVLLLCSDGLTEMIPDDRIAASLQACRDPREACERLVADANDHGGKDNITVITALFEAAPEAHQG